MTCNESKEEEEEGLGFRVQGLGSRVQGCLGR